MANVGSALYIELPLTSFMGFLGGCLRIVVCSLHCRAMKQEIWIPFSAQSMPLQCQLNKLLHFSVCPCKNKGELLIHVNFKSQLGIFFEIVEIQMQNSLHRGFRIISQAEKFQRILRFSMLHRKIQFNFTRHKRQLFVVEQSIRGYKSPWVGL